VIYADVFVLEVRILD